MWTTRRPDGNREDQFEYAPSYLAREQRILMLYGPLCGAVMRLDLYSLSTMCADLLAMNYDDPHRPIRLLIDSPGGLIQDGFMLYDLLRASRAPVTTIGLNVASMATVVFAAGRRRLLLPHSAVMLHLPAAAMEGSVQDINIRSRELNKVKDRVIDAYVACGVTAGLKNPQPDKVRKQILKDIDREFWLTAEEAVAYGLADGIVTTDDLFKSFPSCPPGLRDEGDGQLNAPLAG